MKLTSSHNLIELNENNVVFISLSQKDKCYKVQANCLCMEFQSVTIIRQNI